MLIKYRDRLTIDGVIALGASLRSGDKAPIREFLRTVEKKGRREGELAFPSDFEKAVRFQGFAPSELDAAGASLCSSVVDLRSDPARWEEFLSSEAHEHLAFANKPLVAAHFPKPAPRLVCVHEGRTGRKYARSKAETVEFLALHPGKDSLLSDVALRFGLESGLTTSEELDRFINEDPEARLDAVLDAADMMKEYFFDWGPFGAEIAAKKDWLLERDAASRATVDFETLPAPDYRPAKPSLEAAREELAAALSEILGFALRAGVEEEGRSFQDGLAVLQDGLREPDAFWTSCGLAEDRQRLLLAALLSDNFAGMASWNDVQIEKTDEYRRLSNRACYCILQAILAAVSPA